MKPALPYLPLLLLSDFRSFLTNLPTPERDTFIVRFAGFRLDAILYRKVRAQLFVNFAESRVTLFDAFLEADFADWFRIRVGKFQFPITEERLTPATNLPFVSTAVASLLLPSRDTGVQVFGTFASGRLSFNLALTNGAVAGTLGDSDLDSQKDVVARLYARPFLSTDPGPLQQLGIGLGASTGVHRGTLDNPQLPIFLTYGGQTFFSFRRDRASWSVIPTVVLTGERAAPLSFVVPAHPFDLTKGYLGTIELVGGIGHLRVGSSAFPALANPTTAMQTFHVYGLGLNWFPLSGLAIIISYGHQTFTAAGAAPNRPNEDTLIVRAQAVL